MTTVFTTLKPYLKQAVAQNSETGLPVMRPLFLHYEDDARTYTLKYQYLLGQDLGRAGSREGKPTGPCICRKIAG
jgi:alpha-glucosidase